MLDVLVATAIAAQEVPTPPTPQVPISPAAGEDSTTTIVEVRRIEASEYKGLTLPPVRARPANCEGRHFEFTAASGAASAQKHTSRIVLCSEKGASNERVIVMLEDAARRLESNEQLPAANREKIVSDIRAKAKEMASGS